MLHLRLLHDFYKKLKKKYFYWSLKRRFRKKLRRRIDKKDKWVDPYPPRYDDVYEEGVKWLDSLD